MYKLEKCWRDSTPRPPIPAFFQVAIGIRRKTPQIVDRGATLKARFTENLKPGRTYQVPFLQIRFRFYK
jgi:hypothetical protein